MRTFLRFLGALLFLSLLSVWLVPPMLDWSRYRNSIAALASARLGREVRIAGPVSLRLLPEPVLTAAGVSLGEGGDGIAIRAAQLRLRVALWALAGGRIDAEELVLHGAEMRVPWPLRPVQIAAAAPGWFAGAAVRIEDGMLSIGDLAFAGIAATVGTDAWTGSLSASGTLLLSARPWQFTARLTRAGGDGSAGLDVSLDGRGKVRGVGVKLTGQISGDGTFGGQVMGRGPDLSQLLPAPAVSFAAAGRVSASGGLAAAEGLEGEVGGSPVTGAVALRVAPGLRLDVAVAAGRIDLDAWLPPLLRARGAPFPISIDLSAEAAQLAGGTVRRLRGAFDISGRSIAVREVRAVLPGEASLGATGQVVRRDGEPGSRFEGDVALSAPALRTTLGWLAAAGMAPEAALPEGVLRNAELTARAVLEPGRLALAGLQGRTGGALLSGSLDLHTGERPALAAVLRVDRLDLDPWLPAAWPPLAALPSRLDRVDADLQPTAAQVVIGGAAFGPMGLDGAIEGGQVLLRRLELGGAGVRAVLSGRLGEGGRIADGRLDVQAPSAAALAELLPARFTGLRELSRFWRGPAAVSVQAAGVPSALGMHLAGDLGDLRLDAQPLVDLPARHASFVLTLRHPGAPRLAEALGLRGAPSWLGDGSLGLLAEVAVQLPGPGGPAGRVEVESFDLTAGSLRASGALRLEGLGEDGSVPELAGRIVAETLPLPLPYPRAPDPLPFGALAGWRGQVRVEAAQVLAGGSPVLQGVAAVLSLADAKLRCDLLSARLGAGTLTGVASLDVGGARPALALQARVSGAVLTEKLFDLPVDLAAGRLDAALALTASGHSPAALLATLSGEARLQAEEATLAGVSLGDAAGSLPDAAVRAALAGGSTAFSRVELLLRAQRGVLQVAEGRMSGPAGAAVLTGSLDLTGNAAELRLGLLPAVADPPELGLRLFGPLDQLRRQPELAALARWRAERGAPAE